MTAHAALCYSGLVWTESDSNLLQVGLGLYFESRQTRAGARKSVLWFLCSGNEMKDVNKCIDTALTESFITTDSESHLKCIKLRD